jgi:hypothetical protein
MKWMGGDWTPITSHGELTQGGIRDPQGPEFKYERLNPGIYKILDRTLSEVLRVGYGKKIGLRVEDSFRDVPGRPLAAWWALPEGTFEYQCRELVDDIVGAFYARYGRALRHGFPDS